MATFVKNETEIRKILETITTEVINEVSEKIYTRIDKKSILQHFIKTEVYVSPPNQYYARGSKKPTGEFLKAWSWTRTKVDMRSVVKELFYDPTFLSLDIDEWIHGSFDGDARENLADILNLAFNKYQPGYTSNLMWPPIGGKKHFSKFRQPYWKDFIEFLFDKGELEKMFKDAFAKRGVKKI